jgi:hypothetical protein
MSAQFVQQNPWGALGAFPSQPFAQPFAPYSFGNVAQNPFGGYGASFPQQPLQQIVQSLVIVPQQLQQLLQLAQIQQHQVQYLLQSIPQQLQQLQQQLGHQSAAPTPTFTPYQTWGVPQVSAGISQPFGAQAGYVM